VQVTVLAKQISSERYDNILLLSPHIKSQ